MKIHEYQAKEILRKYNVPVPAGKVTFSTEEAVNIAQNEIGGNVWVVKAQIHAGGRGKGGGVKVAKNLAGSFGLCKTNNGNDTSYSSDRS